MRPQAPTGWGYSCAAGISLLLIPLLLGTATAQTAAKAPRPTQPSTYVNQHTPDWLTIGAAYRFRFEGRTGIGFQEGVEDFYGLGRLLVDIGVQPKPWLKMYFQGQDARSPGKKNSTPFFRDPFDVRQAYLELGELENGWVQARAGRQELKYGAQRLVGPLDWSNTARQFDAAKLTLGKEGMSVDVFASSLVRIDDTAFNKSGKGKNLHGLYGQLNKLIPKTSFEPYLLWKTDRNVSAETLLIGSADIYTAGVRLARPLPKGFDYSMEMARQFGDFAGDDISAWAGYWIVAYTPPAVPLQPRFSLEFDYASGDSDPANGKRGTFDQLYPTGHLYHGIADQVGWQNIRDLRAGVAIKPHPKVKLAFDFFSFWLADKRDHLYNAGGRITVRAPPGGAASSHIGREFDVTAVYSLSTNVKIGGGFGYLSPGKFLKQNSPGAGTSFPYIFCNYVL